MSVLERGAGIEEEKEEGGAEEEAEEEGMEEEGAVEDAEVEVEMGAGRVVGMEGIVGMEGMVGIVEAVETGGEAKGTPLGESTLERMRSHDGESIHCRSQSRHRLHGSKKRLWRKFRWPI